MSSRGLVTRKDQAQTRGGAAGAGLFCPLKGLQFFFRKEEALEGLGRRVTSSDLGVKCIALAAEVKRPDRG